MAKSLTSAQIEALTQATKNVDRLTRLQVFTLATSGLVDVEDGAFIITSKGGRAIKRQVRGQALEANVPVVMAAALEILDTNEAMCNHRQIWNAVGREKFEREDVLDSLRALREEGILDTVKLSGNNFQVFWKRGAAAALIGPVAPQIEAAPVEVIVEA
jgi:hypothetical protein|tara:strand:+ start:198 stop:674 length:477 start_codon:yes stop_codon:yes gene_type:complete